MEDCATLVLAFLQLIFGMTITNLIEYLHFGCHIFVCVVSNDKYTRIAIPTKEEIESYVSAISSQYHALKNSEFSVQWVDLSFILKKHQAFMSKWRFYNGWTHDHYVTNVFEFAPEGTIPISFFQCLWICSWQSSSWLGSNLFKMWRFVWKI